MTKYVLVVVATSKAWPMKFTQFQLARVNAREIENIYSM